MVEKVQDSTNNAGLDDEGEDLHLPAGVSGSELTRRAVTQAQRLGAEFLVPLEVTGVAIDAGYKRLTLSDGRELVTRTLLAATGMADREQTQAEMVKLGTGAEVIRFENRYRCKDGSYRWMLWTAAAFTSRGLIYAAARDITARKRAEEDLRGSEARYRSVIATSQEGIVLLDADGSIRACNASAERILGLSADQMVGRTSLDPRWRAIHEDGVSLSW